MEGVCNKKILAQNLLIFICREPSQPWLPYCRRPQINLDMGTVKESTLFLQRVDTCSILINQCERIKDLFKEKKSCAINFK